MRDFMSSSGLLAIFSFLCGLLFDFLDDILDLCIVLYISVTKSSYSVNWSKSRSLKDLAENDSAQNTFKFVYRISGLILVGKISCWICMFLLY
jgi:hypothetical protein